MLVIKCVKFFKVPLVPSLPFARMCIVNKPQYKLGDEDISLPDKVKKKKSITKVKSTVGENKVVENKQINQQNRDNYEEILKKIRIMRYGFDAPVDTMGPDADHGSKAEKEIRDYQLLVALLISVQNRDESTALAMRKFVMHGLTLDIVNSMSESDVKQILSSVNFNGKKAVYIKRVTSVIINELNGKIPDQLDELLKLPGVGYKIAVLYLNHAHAQNIGIGTDTHVHRISNRLGWVNTKLADQTRVELEKFVDRKYWTDLNKWLVGFGQLRCRPIGPKCTTCLLKDVCPEGLRRLGTSKAEVK